MEGSNSETFTKTHQMNSKAKAGEKRTCQDLDKDSVPVPKRVKMRDLDSVIRSEEMPNRPLESSKTKPSVHTEVVVTNTSQTMNNHLDPNSGSFSEDRMSKKPTSDLQSERGLDSLDLNSEVSVDENSACNEDATCGMDAGKRQSRDAKPKSSGKKTLMTRESVGLDLNTEDVASSVNLNNLLQFKVYDDAKSRDSWECASTTGSMENTASLRKWAEMKQHGFVSPSYCSIPSQPLVPKQRGRKSKTEVLKRKMEQAKKEQIDRFTKIAAPSGLLNGLNPGIINHVRNSKQVHSIIEALVRSEQHEKGHGSGKKSSQMKAGDSENHGSKEQENVNISRMTWSNVSHGNVFSAWGLSSKQMHVDQMKSCHLSDTENRLALLDYCNTRARVHSNSSSLSLPMKSKEDDPLALKLSSSTTLVSKNSSTLSTEECINVDSVNSLSVKAANIASQWLQLLQQDITGRLSALQRSKKRVQDVISTELPFLLNKELSCKPENDSHLPSNSIASCDKKENAELHHIHWNKLFSQMKEALSEEEMQLELRLDQVNKMQQQCEKGLHFAHCNEMLGTPQLRSSGIDNRSKFDDSEGELAVKAAAASIYSTCNFASLMSNVKCC